MFLTQDEFLQALVQLITVRTGLQIRPQDQPNIYKKILGRMQILKTPNFSQYYSLLEASSQQSDREWQALVALLTTGESYLFRDQGQINLLRNKILPEIISYQRDLKIQQRRNKASLKIWSAGCSTGEEAYSIAILVNELLPQQDDWNITILGTDINPEVIKKAKLGIYNAWSFRTVSAELQRRYFSRTRSDWEIDAKIRQMVRFEVGNLIQDPLPSSLFNMGDFDLILCRNVFIYFNSEAIAKVLTKFYHSLRPGGYLITGHAELFGQELSLFQAQVLPESMVYQRRTSSPIPEVHQPEQYLTPALPQSLQTQRSPFEKPQGSAPPLTRELGKSAKPPSPTPEKTHIALCQAALEQAERLLKIGVYASALQATSQAIKYDPNSFDAYYLAAQAHANLGQHQNAQDFCKRAIKLNSASLKPYYLLAKIAEEQGEVELAKSILRKIIYLDPKAIAAYLDLGAIHSRENEPAKAMKMHSTALELLKQVSPHTTIEYQEQLAAGELLLYVKKMMHRNG